jgi:parallel beta-helix repeat protein
MNRKQSQSKLSRIKSLLILLFSLSALSLSSCSTQQLPNEFSRDHSAAEIQTTRSTSHSQIAINGDDAFTPANGVTGGNGTQADPYRISGWYINGYLGGVAIALSNTTKHVIIENNELSQSVIGIKLESAPNVTIRNNTIRDMKGWAGIFPAGNGDPAFGIYISSSNSVTITGNNIYRIYGGAGAAGSMSLSKTPSPTSMPERLELVPPVPSELLEAMEAMEEMHPTLTD